MYAHSAQLEVGIQEFHVLFCYVLTGNDTWCLPTSVHMKPISFSTDFFFLTLSLIYLTWIINVVGGLFF